MVYPIIIEKTIPGTLWVMIGMIVNVLDYLIAGWRIGLPYIAFISGLVLALAFREFMLEYEWGKFWEAPWRSWDRMKSGHKLRQLPDWFLPGQLCIFYLCAGLGSLAIGSILGGFCGFLAAVLYAVDYRSRWNRAIRSGYLKHYALAGAIFGASSGFRELCRALAFYRVSLP